MKLYLPTAGYIPPITCSTLLSKAKSATLVTYTISDVAVEWLNWKSKSCDVLVYAAKLSRCTESDAKFNLVLRPKNHAKIWLIDGTFYAGSANLSGDSIGNVMCKIENPIQVDTLNRYLVKLSKNLPLNTTLCL